MTGFAVRPATTQDQEAIGALAETANLFPADALPAMISPYLEGASEAHWLVAHDHGQLLGFLYSEPEMFTDGTNNLRAMATLPNARKLGVGSSLIDQLQSALARKGQRIILVETSSTEPFEGTRAFYRNRGFREEARICDFWAEGDDKIIFWKAVRQTC